MKVFLNRFCSRLCAAFTITFLLFLCLSCQNETVDSTPRKKTPQEHYKDFLARKAAWTEPENYTFTYEYSFGDAVVGPSFTVVVTDGVGVCTSNCEQDTEFDEFRFTSISQMYDYIDASYQKALKSAPATGDTIHYYGVTYNKSYGYPEIWQEVWGVSGACGYGGDYVRVWDFTLTNHKTYKELCDSWEEPAKPYSFMYDIDYVANGINNVWSTGQITVSVAEDGTVTRSHHNDSTENYERFLSYFGDYEIFEDGLLFNSIADFFRLGEKVWTSEEAKCERWSNYRVTPIVTTLTTEKGRRYALEISSFLSDEYGGATYPLDPEDGENETRTTVLSSDDYRWTRFRAYIWIYN